MSAGAALGLTIALLAGAGAPAQPPSDSVPGSELTIRLLTFDPGPLLWERFGHNALWVEDRRAGTNWTYDYGRFSFGRTFADQVGFAVRFARGLPRYSMGDGDVRAYLAAYQAAGRGIWVQELDLPPAARLALRDFLVWNIRPENREYPYDYYLDNCSTRIRDAIDRVIGGQLRQWADTARTAMSYRDQTRRTTENGPVIHTLIMFGLGQPVDRPLSSWEAMFLPISLRPDLDRVIVTDPDGRIHPLVKTSRQLVASDRFAVAERPTRWTAWYLAAGLAGGAVLLLAGRGARSSARWRLGFGALAVGWALTAGIGGAVLTSLWGFTSHRFSSPNENVLQLSLLSLALAMVLPAGIWRATARHRFAVGLAFATAAASALGLALKVLPPFYQDNLDQIALVLPLHLGLWLGLAAAGPAPER